MCCCTKRCECKHNVQSNCLRGQWSDTLLPLPPHIVTKETYVERRGFSLSPLSFWSLRSLILITVITDSDHCDHSDSDHDSGEKGMQQNQREESRFTALRHMILTWQNARCGSSSFSLWCSEVVGETERDDFIYFFSSSLHCLHCCSIYNTLSWEVKEWESISCCLFCCSSVCSWSVHERRKYTKIKKQDGRLYDYTIRQNNNTINKTKHHS